MAFTSWSPHSLTEGVRFTMPLDWNGVRAVATKGPQRRF